MAQFDSLADEQASLEAALRPLLTPAFLTTLVHAARVGGFGGFDGDIYEVDRFVDWCHTLVDQRCPELYHCDKSAFTQDPPLPSRTS
jgi:hypothetical protein